MSAIANRRAAFAAVVAGYHNSFANATEAHQHSPQFIKNVLALDEAGKAALKSDPRLTSTDAGAIAIGIAKMVSTNEKVARSFVDVEIGESAYVVTFDADIKPDLAASVLTPCGTSAVFCKPGDKLAEGVVADVLIFAVEPTQAVQESMVKACKEVLAEGGAEHRTSNHPAILAYNAARDAEINAEQQKHGTKWNDELLARFAARRAAGRAQRQQAGQDRVAAMRDAKTKTESAVEEAEGRFKAYGPDSSFVTADGQHKWVAGKNLDYGTHDHRHYVKHGAGWKHVESDGYDGHDSKEEATSTAKESRDFADRHMPGGTKTEGTDKRPMNGERRVRESTIAESHRARIAVHLDGGLAHSAYVHNGGNLHNELADVAPTHAAAVALVRSTHHGFSHVSKNGNKTYSDGTPNRIHNATDTEKVANASDADSMFYHDGKEWQHYRHRDGVWHHRGALKPSAQPETPDNIVRSTTEAKSAETQARAKAAAAAVKAKSKKSVKESAVELFAYCYGDKALAQIDESKRGDAALAHMMRVFKGGPKTETGSTKFDAIITQAIKARKLNESADAWGGFLDDVAVAIFESGDADVLAEVTIDDNAGAKTVESVEDRLLGTARIALMGAGVVAPTVQEAFGVFTEATDEESHAAATTLLKSHGVANAHAFAHRFHGILRPDVNHERVGALVNELKEKEAGAPPLPAGVHAEHHETGDSTVRSFSHSFPNVEVQGRQKKYGKEEADPAHVSMSSGDLRTPEAVTAFHQVLAWAHHHVARLNAKS